MLRNGDKVGIVACSNPQREEDRPQMQRLRSVLQDMGLVPVWSNYIYAVEKTAGVLLGTFSQLEAEAGMPRPEDILQKYIREDLPVAVTRQIGHGTDSKAIWIGKELL